MNSVCTCKSVANKNDKLVKCTNVDCPNGMFFHLPCLGRKRMPNNNKVWFCPACMMSNAQKPTEGTAPKPAAMHVTTNTRPTVTYVSTNTKPTVTRLNKHQANGHALHNQQEANSHACLVKNQAAVR